MSPINSWNDQCSEKNVIHKSQLSKTNNLEMSPQVYITLQTYIPKTIISHCASTSLSPDSWRDDETPTLDNGPGRDDAAAQHPSQCVCVGFYQAIRSDFSVIFSEKNLPRVASEKGCPALPAGMRSTNRTLMIWWYLKYVELVLVFSPFLHLLFFCSLRANLAQHEIVWCRLRKCSDNVVTNWKAFDGMFFFASSYLIWDEGRIFSPVWHLLWVVLRQFSFKLWPWKHLETSALKFLTFKSSYSTQFQNTPYILFIFHPSIS